MAHDIQEATIVDYLYGELSPSEKKKLEEAMEADASLTKEVEEMAQVMEFMGRYEDKEVLPPAFVFPGEEKVQRIGFFQSNPFKWTASIAACLFVLLMSAYLMGFHVLSDEERMMIGFASDKNNSMTKNEVTSMIHDALAAYNQKRDEKLSELEIKLSGDLTQAQQNNLKTMKGYIASNSEASQRMLRRYIDQTNTANRQMIANYFEVSDDKQKKYINSVLTDFSQFYNKQRRQDLEIIKAGWEGYREASVQKQYETDLLLASLMDRVDMVDKVSTQNKQQYNERF